VTVLDTTQQIPTEIVSFLDGLLQDAGMTSLDKEMHDEMIKELFARLDNYLTATLVEKLTPEDTETFIKMNEEKKSKEEVEKFLQEKLPNAQETMTNAFMEFRDLYLGNVVAQRNAPASTAEDTATPKQN
jgi:Mg/Co/Ni transporter MgtE